MTRAHQTSTRGFPWWWVGIVVIAAAVGGAVRGLNFPMMLLAAIGGLVVTGLLANLHDIGRYLRMRRM